MYLTACLKILFHNFRMVCFLRLTVSLTLPYHGHNLMEGKHIYPSDMMPRVMQTDRQPYKGFTSVMSLTFVAVKSDKELLGGIF